MASAVLVGVNPVFGLYASMAGPIGGGLAVSTRRMVVTTTTAAAPGTPVLVTSMTRPPAGYRLNAGQVQRIALADPRVQAQLRRHPRAEPYEYTKGPGQWQVSWFSQTKPQTELM